MFGDLLSKENCEGCQQRAEIMGAGNWELDATVVVVLLILSGVIIYLAK